MTKAYSCNWSPSKKTLIFWLACCVVWLQSVDDAAICCAQQPAEAIQDLVIPALETGDPLPGKRVKQQLDSYQRTSVYHIVYLPSDWVAEESYPVIVEFPGNRYRQRKGLVDECCMGFGITKGEGAIWVSLPLVNAEEGRNQDLWWGDAAATAKYAEQVVEQMIGQFGGDPKRVVLAGFSRGAIACNFIGLRNDQIASTWCGFVCHSHYDGVRRWHYEGSDERSAAERLQRLGGRPQFVCHEGSVAETRDYLQRVMPDGEFTFCDLKGWGHTDRWVLFDVPERKRLRDWYAELVSEANDDEG